MTQEPESKEKSAEKSPLNEQIADIVLKVIMTGGVAGGGVSAFWSLLKDSDVPKAIISAVIGLGISYAAKMLLPVHEGTQRRLEKAGKALDEKVDDVTEYVAGKATGGTIEDRYLYCQALDCQTVRSEGLAQHEGIFKPLLEEVFVPLALDSHAILPGFKASQLEISTDNELKIWDFLARTPKEPTFRQLAILAWGGYGKTTLLKHITYIYGSKKHQQYRVPKRIPVLLVLRKYRDLLAQDNPPTLPQLIATYHVPNLPEAADLQVTPERAKEWLNRGEAIVMLDGFDEVAKVQRPAVARWIDEQMRRYGKSVFILTSRPKAYKEQETVDRLEFTTPIWIKDFKAKQRQDFVERWYLCQERYAHGGRNTPDVRQTATQAASELLAQIEARQELKDLAKNPLLLNMIVTFHRRYPGAELPKRRVELYREICQLQLKDRPRARKLETLLTQCEAQTLLQMLALEMMQQHQERIDRYTILQQLAGYLTSEGETVEAREFLEQVEQIGELLVEREPDEFEFAHLSFQEYLAATQIAQQKQENLLYQHFRNDWWKQTILLYAAQTKNPTNLIREAMQQGATDLAYACLQETTKRVDPALEAELKALKQTVQASRYQALDDYLKNGQWKQADEETYRLMITTVGKEEGQRFDSEDLLNFPCEELRAIDGLWVKYSNGKFGFSVQKKIYLQCGGIPDGRHHKEAWNKFCHAVGWMKNNNYLHVDVSHVSMSTCLEGLFPRVIVVEWRGGGEVLWEGRLASSLASRLVKCNL